MIEVVRGSVKSGGVWHEPGSLLSLDRDEEYRLVQQGFARFAEEETPPVPAEAVLPDAEAAPEADDSAAVAEAVVAPAKPPRRRARKEA